MPRFLERDEAEREPPCRQYPWDGVRNVRPFSRFGTTVVEGVTTSLNRTPNQIAWNWGRLALSWSEDMTMTSSSDPPSGRPLPEPRRRPRAAPPHARAVRRDQPGQRRPDSPRSARERAGGGARALARLPVDALIDMCAQAADHFSHDTLPLGDGEQSPRRLRRAGVGDHRHAARRWCAATCSKSPAC